MAENVTGVRTEFDPKKFTNPTLAFLRAYWDEKRGQRSMPSRSDIRPSEMKEHLGWILLLDVLDGGEDFRFRTVGTRVSEYFLMDGTGKTLSEAFAPYGEAAVAAVLATHRKVACDAVVLRAHGRADLFGRAFLDFDALYLPLSADGQAVNMILSGFTFDLSALLKVRGAPPDAT
jgi:hypothetical protein